MLSQNLKMHKMFKNLCKRISSYPLSSPKSSGELFFYETFMMFRFDMNLFDFSNVFKGENKVKENEEMKGRGLSKSPKISKKENAKNDKEKDEMKVSSKEDKKKY